MEMSGNTVLITGGASGIGYALAEAFLASGSTVGICGRRASRLTEAKARHTSLRTCVCDLSNDEGRDALFAWATAELPGLNILVNNAGVQRDIDLTSGIGAFRAGENEIRINLEATVVLCGLFAPLLAKTARAAIINVSSGLGFAPMASMPVYCASKAGVHAFSMALRRQLASRGVKVFEIVPPAVDTGLNPEGRAGRGQFQAHLSAQAFVAGVVDALRRDVPEIGFGMTERLINASRSDLDQAFERMNGAVAP